MQDTPKDLDKKRTDEKLLVSEMIALYCRGSTKHPKEPCARSAGSCTIMP